MKTLSKIVLILIGDFKIHAALLLLFFILFWNILFPIWWSAMPRLGQIMIVFWLLDLLWIVIFILYIFTRYRPTRLSFLMACGILYLGGLFWGITPQNMYIMVKLGVATETCSVQSVSNYKDKYTCTYFVESDSHPDIHSYEVLKIWPFGSEN